MKSLLHRITTLAVGACCSVCVSAGTLYMIKEKDGTVRYTDMPVAGAVPVDLSGVNSAVMPALAPTKTAPATKTVQRPAVQYDLSITAPADGATIRNNLGNFSVSGQVSPTGPGVFQLLMDGNVVATNPIPQFSLESVDRGEHTLQLQLVDNTGKILASSPQHTVYLHRASALITPSL
ncbi:DUF4124 domain-containing protein [Aestuariibacter halophilus]|uniref:DUF4124 domain-containing protein n=1 Tax=Fluctibacter halophilus TaxID=226011 RepID=A0ABS8GAP3_9ALTE|nr:DUF4124 domain-containing protein [Aestuariibacter halophilus]MCC2617478.1 DUF4124 domain-containing protein [Aestuariibacter halophilus]